MTIAGVISEFPVPLTYANESCIMGSGLRMTWALTRLQDPKRSPNASPLSSPKQRSSLGGPPVATQLNWFRGNSISQNLNGSVSMQKLHRVGGLSYWHPHPKVCCGPCTWRDIEQDQPWQEAELAPCSPATASTLSQGLLARRWCPL